MSTAILAAPAADPASPDWLLYGANGYTGELIAREAVRRGLRPVLAGRSAAVARLAQELGLEARIFGLDDADSIDRALAGCRLVLNCAGPFSATAQPIMDACLRGGVHYLDITGEIAVFELAQSLHDAALAAGCVLCPGVGFDVIPTDCVAVALKAALPDANALALGFDSRSGLSSGTARTSVEGLAQGGKLRRGGRIVTVPLAWGHRRIDFGDGEKDAITIPWGDVASAGWSTGIADVEVYMAAPPRLIAQARRANLIRPLLRWKPLQRLAGRVAARAAQGPDAAARERHPTFVWGEARNARGEIRTARIRTANGYSLTVSGSLTVVEHLLRHPAPAGCHTPAQLMGADLVQRLPGSGPLRIG